MAKNRVQSASSHISAVASDPASPVSGDPVRVGDFCGVALTDKRADNTVSIQRNGIFNLSVKGIDGGGNSAVAVGDTLYYVDADTPKISKKNTGKKIGYAMAVVNSAATTTIAVMLG